MRIGRDEMTIKPVAADGLTVPLPFHRQQSSMPNQRRCPGQDGDSARQEQPDEHDHLNKTHHILEVPNCSPSRYSLLPNLIALRFHAVVHEFLHLLIGQALPALVFG